MNVLFLDIDGTICTPRTFAANRAYGRTGRDLYNFDEVGVGLIKAICKKYDVKIVLSSTWRKFSVMSEEGDDLSTHVYRNFKRLDILQFVHEDWKTNDLRHLDKMRGVEIKEWLSRHLEIKKYAIVDDDRDMLSE